LPLKIKAKPELRIDLPSQGAGALPALDRLSSLIDAPLHHDKIGVRHPLGIYNLSVARVSNKVVACATKLEALIQTAATLSELHALEKESEELVDYLELCLYAAAEHVDDVESIAVCCFASKKEFKRSLHARKMLKEVKVIRDRLTAIANALKHHQARIRLYAIEFQHGRRPMCLHGLFVEAFHQGTVGPSPIFHAGIEKVISLPSFLWELMVYVFEMSVALDQFLQAVQAVKLAECSSRPSEVFTRACIATARLPNYSFDGAHPFERVRLVVGADEANDKLLVSNLYGSIRMPWSQETEHTLGGHVVTYRGDGVTKSFALVQPSTIRLQHWK
jgi:hypothetical protein